MKDVIRILIVEDDPIIATDIRGLLTHEGLNVCGVAKNGLRALDMMHALRPNFAVIDIHLGHGPSGIDVAEVIHTKYHFPYIFLTSFSDPDTLAAAQEQSPYGYLVKPFQDQTLLTTISVAWHRFQQMTKSSEPGYPTDFSILTDQEKSIALLLIQGRSYNQMCDELDITINTLKYHVKNIYSKFDISGRSELTAMVYG